MNKEFLSILERSKKIHTKKNQDYTSGTNVDENFERVAEIVSWFNNSIDKAFASFIAVKLARIASLLNKSSTPNFESIDDTFVDLVTYSGLWGGNVSRRLNSNKYEFIGTCGEQQKAINQQQTEEESIVIKTIRAFDLWDNNNPKQRKIKEIIGMQYTLDDDDYRQLLSLARILKSRKG